MLWYLKFASQLSLKFISTSENIEFLMVPESKLSVLMIEKKSILKGQEKRNPSNLLKLEGFFPF